MQNKDCHRRDDRGRNNRRDDSDNHRNDGNRSRNKRRNDDHDNDNQRNYAGNHQEQSQPEDCDQEHGDDRYDDSEEDDGDRNYCHYHRRTPLPVFTDCDNEYSWIAVFTRDLHLYIYPKTFKPIGINQYDGKTLPTEWL